MNRLLIKVTVALLTFCIGIVAAMLYFTRNNPPAIVPQTKQTEEVSSATTCFPGLSVEVRSNNSKSSSYFPQGVFSENQWQDQSRVDWYSKHLKAMGESSLLSNVEGESYRFLWLRTFHHPIAVRVWRSGDTISLNVKQLSGAGGYEPGKLVINQTRSLTESEWREFIALLEKSCYWQMPVKDDRMLEDGAQWILEGVKDGRYHIVDRQSPEGGNYREACFFLLKISGIKISDKEVY